MINKFIFDRTQAFLVGISVGALLSFAWYVAWA